MTPSSALRPLGHQPPQGKSASSAASSAPRSTPVWPPETILVSLIRCAGMTITKVIIRTRSRRNSPMTRPGSTLLLALALGMLALPALAQSFPNKPVRILVPLAPGGGMDTVARGLGQRLSEVFGQTVV